MIAKKRISDPPLAGYIKFLGAATRRSPKQSVARQFLAEARIRYRQYRRSGDERMRYSCWSAIQIGFRALEKEGQALKALADAAKMGLREGGDSDEPRGKSN